MDHHCGRVTTHVHPSASPSQSGLVAKPSEVVAATLFLLSDEVSYIARGTLRRQRVAGGLWEH